MTYSPIIHIRTLSALVFACAVAVFFAQPATAQTAKKLNCNGCVKSKQLKNDGIKTKDLKNGAVTTSKLATPTGAAGVSQVNVLDLTPNETVNSITVDLPGPGVVIVNASGYMRFDSNNAQGECTITKGNVVGSPFIRATGSNADQDDRREAFAGTRAFVEDTGGTHTYKLLCSPDGGDDVDIYDALMTAIYAPNNIAATP